MLSINLQNQKKFVIEKSAFRTDVNTCILPGSTHGGCAKDGNVLIVSGQ